VEDSGDTFIIILKVQNIGASREVFKRIGLNNNNTVQEFGDQQEQAGVPEERNFYRRLEPAMPTVAEEHYCCFSEAISCSNAVFFSANSASISSITARFSASAASNSLLSFDRDSTCVA
jgi:hypothetical protein